MVLYILLHIECTENLEYLTGLWFVKTEIEVKLHTDYNTNRYGSGGSTERPKPTMKLVTTALAGTV